MVGWPLARPSMSAPGAPAWRESERLAALHSLELLDTPPDQALDDITELAAHICDAPIALITLVDSNRQWFKSRFGLELTETAREFAFCALAIADPTDVMVVEDATQDPRFAGNPLVTGYPGIRFYAGAPLVTIDGFPLGTLCVIDRKPRGLEHPHLLALRALRRCVISEFELRRVALGLQAANADLQAFSAALAHDLQAPLRAMQGFSKMLHADPGLTESQRQLVGRIGDSSQRMVAVVEALLRLFRSPREPLQREDVDLSALAREVGEELRRHYTDARAELRVHEGLRAHGDRTLLRQVMENLLSNAFKFTSATAGARVEFGAHDKDGVLHYFVRDNGPGFDMARARRLFQPFERLPEAGAFPGTGIGLSTVARIIRRHAGKVWAESQPGAGATFYFTLGK